MNTVSWSKNGFIAYSGGSSVYLTYLENINGREWQLAPLQRFRVTGHDGTGVLGPIKHVAWSNLSTDLAVCDHQGNFFVLLAGVGLVDHEKNGANGSSVPPGANGSGANGAANGASTSGGGASASKSAANASKRSTAYELTSYNQLVVTYRDVIHDRNEVVAARWLNVEKNNIVPKPAVLVNTGPEGSPAYQYGVSLQPPLGLAHPIASKQACVVLRQNGEITLYYQGEHKVDYFKVSHRLPSMYATHGLIGLTRDRRLVVVAHNAITGKLAVYAVRIDWGFLVDSALKQKSDPHYNTPEDARKPPSLLVDHVADMLHQPEAVDYSSRGPHIGSSLLSIDLLSPAAVSDSQLDVFVAYGGDNCTHLYQYQMGGASEVISPQFGELGKKRENKAAQKAITPILRLLLVSHAVRPALLTSVQVTFSDIFALFNYNDGRVDVVDRRKMALVDTYTGEAPPATVSSIFDVGFSFPRAPLAVCVSGSVAYLPTMTARVYAEDTGDGSQPPRMCLQTVERTDGAVNPKALFITSVGFAFCHSYACYANICADDFVVTIQQEVQRVTRTLRSTRQEKLHHIEVVVAKFVELVICELHKAINFQLDAFGKESVDKLLLNPPLQKLLSLQMALGELQDHGRLVSDLAWIVLNLRSTSFGIMFLLSNIYRQVSKKKPAEDTMADSVARAECIVSLVGSVRWLIDLIIYLNQEFNQLANSNGDPDISRLTMKNSVALPIVLSKVPRLFLMYALSSIQKTHDTLKKLHKDLVDANRLFPPMRDALDRYFTTCANLPLHVSTFESFLRDTDAIIASEVARNSKFEKKGFQLRVEQKLVFQGEVAEEYLPIATAVVAKYASGISLDMKVSELFFYDVDWIGVGIQWLTDECVVVDNAQDVLLRPPQAAKPMVPRLAYGEGDCVDALRKVVVLPLKPDTKIRKCTRCRSVSLVNDPMVFNSQSTLGLWTMVFQRSCICGSIWINTELSSEGRV